MTDEQWSRIEPLLPPEKPSAKGGRPAKSHRMMIEAILWIYDTGRPWRDLDPSFGPWQSVYTRYSRWTRSGILAKVLEALSREHDASGPLVDPVIARVNRLVAED